MFAFVIGLIIDVIMYPSSFFGKELMIYNPRLVD